MKPATTEPRAARSKPIDVLETVATRLRQDPRLGLERLPLRLALEEGTLEVDGEVSSIAVKKRTIRLAASTPGILWVVDRLRVKPAEPMEDGAVRDHVIDALLGEPALVECGIRKEAKHEVEVLRQPREPRSGDVCVAVEDGVVTLDGEVPTRAHKRLAGVLAWWVPGSRDVVDGLGVLSPEEDNDDEISDAIRTALEKDPFVEASQIRVTVTNGVATLAGFVPSESQREMAELDAWYVSGVAEVTNSIDVAQSGSLS